MKAIVLEVRNGKACLLFEDGTTGYRRVNAQAGEYVEIENAPGSVTTFKKVTRTVGTMAAMLALVFGLGNYYSTMVMDYSYVSVDVNPSIEFSLNKRDKVVRVEALNKDAEEIVAQLKDENVKGATISEAMEKTVESLAEKGYMAEDKEDTSYMLIDVASKGDKKTTEISDELETYLSADESPDVTYALLHSTVEERQKAKQAKLSSGRYQKLVAAYGEEGVSKETVKEYRVKPVKDLVTGEDTQTAAAAEDPKEKDPKDKDKEKEKDPKEKTETAAGTEGTAEASSQTAAAGSAAPAAGTAQPAVTPTADGTQQPANPQTDNNNTNNNDTTPSTPGDGTTVKPGKEDASRDSDYDGGSAASDDDSFVEEDDDDTFSTEDVEIPEVIIPDAGMGEEGQGTPVPEDPEPEPAEPAAEE